MEAIAQGTPVVASDIAAHREFKVGGLDLVPVGEDRALAEAIAARLEDRSRVTPRDDGRSMRHVAQETVAVYQSL